MEKIKELIQNGYENESLDFKSKQYKNSVSLLKDVMAMANSYKEDEKYIIVGIKAYPNGNKEIVGINRDEFKDSSEYQQFISENIEPILKLEYLPCEYDQKLIGVLKIIDSNDKPYMMRKKYSNLERGICYVRQGSQQRIAVRSDYDVFYYLKESFKVKLIDKLICLSSREQLFKFRILLSNHSKNLITIVGGLIRIYNQENKLITEFPLYGFGNEIGWADFTHKISPRDEELGNGHFGFCGNAFFQLGLDSYGTAEQLFIAKFIVWDSSGNEYLSDSEEIIVVAKGDYLKYYNSKNKCELP